MDNLEIYNKVREVPAEAQKEIRGGNISGFTDINPMWRIKILTEQFGVCGVGWYTEILSQWIETCVDKRTAAFCNINLYIKIDGEWSKPIPGTGGSMLTDLAKGSPKSSDECFKMAYTDALSVCCKMLGVGADIYWDKDATKYDKEPEPIYACERCGELFKCGEYKGMKFTAKEAYDKAFELWGAHICGNCYKNGEPNAD